MCGKVIYYKLEIGLAVESVLIAERLHTHSHTHTLYRQRFGHLVEVRGDKFDTYIENSLPQTFVIMHIYDEVCREYYVVVM